MSESTQEGTTTTPREEGKEPASREEPTFEIRVRLKNHLEWHAECPTLNLSTQGSNLHKALTEMAEAIETYLDGPDAEAEDAAALAEAYREQGNEPFQPLSEALAELEEE